MKIPNHKTLLQLIREHINLSSGMILREDLIKIARKNGNADTYCDSLRRQLTVVGYLEDTNKPGVYRILARIPNSLTSDKLRKLVNKKYDDSRLNIVIPKNN